MEYEVISYKGKESEVRAFLRSKDIIIKDYNGLKRFFRVDCSEDVKLELENNENIKYIVNSDYYDNLEPGATQNLDMVPDNWALSRICRRDYPADSSPYNFNSPFPNQGTTYGYNRTGKSVDIYIIDTGVYINHDDFEDRAEMIFSCFSGDMSDLDRHHGTSVASAAAGKRFGVAKDARIYGLKISTGDENREGKRRTVDAFDYVIEHHKEKIKNGVNRPSIVNYSYHGGWALVFFDELRDNGIVGVTIAGNKEKDLDEEPEKLVNVITVAATDSMDRPTMFTGYGSVVDIWAPGQEMSLAVANEKVSDYANDNMSGTSFSTPTVAGVCALILEGSDIGNNNEYVDKVKNILISNSTKNKIDFNNRLVADKDLSDTPNKLVYSMIDNEPIKTNVVEEKKSLFELLINLFKKFF